MSIRQTIIDAATQKGVSYRDVARRAGLPVPTVHRFWHGKIDLTTSRIDRLLDALGLVVAPRRRVYRRQPLATATASFMEPLPDAKPLFRYPGSKWRLMADAIRLMPPHRHFVSVFGGSASDLLRKPKSRLETFNDLDGGVHNMFTVLQAPALLRRLKQRIKATPASCQKQYEEALAVLKTAESNPTDKAWAFLLVSFQGFCSSSPTIQSKKQWRFAVKPHSTSKSWLSLPETLSMTSRRFQQVQVTQWPWEKVIKTFDSPASLFFLDPPYLPHSTDRRSYYAHNMKPDEHERLLVAIQRVKGLVMLCGYDNPLYSRYLRRWRAVDFGTAASLDANGHRPKRTERIWMNYDEQGKRFAV